MNKKIKDKTTEYNGEVLGVFINDNKKMLDVGEVTNPKIRFGNWQTIKGPIQEWIKGANKDIAFVENLIKKGYVFDRGAYRDSKTKDAQIFHNSNGHDYEIIEYKNGNALLHDLEKDVFQPWVCAWSLGKSSWGQGHYFNTEEAARKYWKANYAKDSLKSYSVDGITVDAKSVTDAIKKVKDATRKSLVDEAELALRFLKRGSQRDDELALEYFQDVVEHLKMGITDASIGE